MNPKPKSNPSKGLSPHAGSLRNAESKAKGRAEEGTKAAEDVAVVYGKSEDGAGVRVIRKRADRVELGEIRPLEHGKPLNGELVQLRQRGDSPVFDVDVQLPAQKSLPLTTSGPAQVASDEYRRNWDAIWSTPKGDKKLLN